MIIHHPTEMTSITPSEPHATCHLVNLYSLVKLDQESGRCFVGRPARTPNPSVRTSRATVTTVTPPIHPSHSQTRIRVHVVDIHHDARREGRQCGIVRGSSRFGIPDETGLEGGMKRRMDPEKGSRGKAQVGCRISEKFGAGPRV